MPTVDIRLGTTRTRFPFSSQRDSVGFPDVPGVLPRARQRSVHLFRFHDVLRRHPNQPVLASRRRHVDDVLHIRHGVRGRRDFPISVLAGDQK